MAEPEFKDGTRWTSGYYSAIARLSFFSILAACSIAGLIALTTEWDPIQAVEESPDWQKFVIGAVLAFVTVRSVPPVLSEANLLLFTDHYVPYTAAQKRARWRNHRAG